MTRTADQILGEHSLWLRRKIGKRLRWGALSWDERADLSGADLSGAVLSEADLSGAYLSGADLTEGLAIVQGPTRSDGYCFFLYACCLGAHVIKAGCREMTFDEYRAHVAANYPDTDKADETLAILDFLEGRLRQQLAKWSGAARDGIEAGVAYRAQGGKLVEAQP